LFFFTLRSHACFAPHSAEKKVAQLAAGLSAAVATSMASPLFAEAAATPSLNNFIGSLFAGATVLAGIAGAITLVSRFDIVNRD
jgi:hypothetical protein